MSFLFSFISIKWTKSQQSLMINQTMVKKAKLDDHFVFYMLPTSSNQGKRDQKSQCGKRISPNTGVIINTHAE